MDKAGKIDRPSLHSFFPPVVKLGICSIIATAVYFIFPLKNTHSLTRLMLACNTFFFCMLSLYWLIFFVSKPSQIRTWAPKEDPSRVVVFFIILLATSASMLAVILLLLAGTQSDNRKVIELIVAIAGTVLSWSLVHTVFAVRYAHLYYDDDKENKTHHAAGLEFPKEDKPDFIDFAYFSFVLGMTFQVSDVSISSRRIRRLVLWHSLISFAYNVVIIALTINILAGLGKN